MLCGCKETGTQAATTAQNEMKKANKHAHEPTAQQRIRYLTGKRHPGNTQRARTPIPGLVTVFTDISLFLNTLLRVGVELLPPLESEGSSSATGHRLLGYALPAVQQHLGDDRVPA